MGRVQTYLDNWGALDSENGSHRPLHSEVGGAHRLSSFPLSRVKFLPADHFSSFQLSREWGEG